MNIKAILSIAALVVASSLYAVTPERFSLTFFFEPVEKVSAHGPGYEVFELPSYPVACLSAGIQDSIEITFLVDDQGVVSDIEIKKSEIKELAESVLTAAKRWKFKPAIATNGKPISIKMRGVIGFQSKE